MVKVLLSLDDYWQSLLIVFLGLEPGAAEWKAQMNPLSYRRHPKLSIVEVKETLRLKPEIGCL